MTILLRYVPVSVRVMLWLAVGGDYTLWSVPPPTAQVFARTPVILALPFISVMDRSFGALAVTETPDRSFGALAGVASPLRMMLSPIFPGMLTP